MVRLKIDLKKRDFIWVGLVVVMLGFAVVIAYGGNDPSVMGHSAGEIEPLSEIYLVPIATLQNYMTPLDCNDLPAIQYFQGACHRYCHNVCAAGGVNGCNGSPDSGLDYVSGFVAQIDCEVTGNVGCVCIN